MRRKQRRKQKQTQSLSGYFLLLVIFFVSAGIMAYPLVSEWVNSKFQKTTTSFYQETFEKMPETDYSAYWQQAVAYNDAILRSGAILTDPFDFAAVKQNIADEIGVYEDILNFSDVMATIEIPEIDVNLPIYHGTDADTLDKGVGHMEATSLPVGGAGTHCVLTGHTGLPGKTLFTNLIKLEIGDVFLIHVMNETLAYRVDDISVVLPDDLHTLTLDNEHDYVTLITCTPYGVNDHRLLVRGTRINWEEQTPEEVQQIEAAQNIRKPLSTIEIVEIVAFSIAFILFIIMLVLTITTIIGRRKEKHGAEEDEEDFIYRA